MDKHKRMEELVDELNDLAYRYYVLDKPKVSDAEYDKLYDELLALEEELGPLPHSPTRRVGGEPLTSFRPHRHIAPLWSLDKVRTEEDLRAWAARAAKLADEHTARTGDTLPPIRYTVEMKFDGLTINLTYRDGELLQAATRGNGEVGEAILPQARTIRGLPLKVPFAGTMEVQGEGIMKLSAFNEYNRTTAEPLKNARNGAAGALRNLDPKVTASRKLSAFFYNIGYIEGHDVSNHVEMIEFIRSCRLPTSPFLKLCSTVDEVLEVIREAEGDRPRLDFLIDGMVVKINDFRTREALGYTNKFPRWAVAWKFEAEEMTTVVRDIVWDAGRTGKLTPVAELEPVEIAGATVKRATLNNWDDIVRKSVKIGGRVWIRRSNEVIPEIMGGVEEESVGATDPVKPEKCPACGSSVAEIGANLFCPNGLGCPPQAVSRLVHYASRNAMDIETFSDKTASMFFRELGMRDISDLYALERERLIGLPGFGEKKADNLLAAIEKSKDIELNRFIFALGIPDVGEKTAKDIAKRFGSFDAVRCASYEDLIEIRDVGSVVAQSIVDFFADPHTRETLDKILAAGVKPRDTMTNAHGQGEALAGMTFVLTGTLPTLERKQVETLIEKHGGKTSGSVSARTSFVLLGAEPGSKYEKAKELGIPCIAEEEFLRMIGGQ
jgi:DNA ligase (NAD+)